MKDFSTLVAASLLSADFAYIADAVKLAEESGSDWIHLDVMDGSFVPNLTFGPKMVADIRKLTNLPLDVHLMIERPEQLVDEFIAAGADHITFHTEASVHIHRLIGKIHDAGKKAGLSIVPSTPVAVLNEMLPSVDIVLVMTVNPGFGGQSLIDSCLKKIRDLAGMRTKSGHAYHVAVDGGINRTTVESVRDAGADVLISGSAFFGSDNPKAEVTYFRGVTP
jgi:ribulose-phosphate 3-epimerase